MNPREQIQGYIDQKIGREETLIQFQRRLENPKLTRDEGELTHFCVFLMAVDPNAKMIYIGHHKKSDRWIPNGGHVDIGESIDQTATREVWEEWGKHLSFEEIGPPKLLTVTEIENPAWHHICLRHYEVWYFITVNQNEFSIDPEILHQEFYEAKWVNLSDAKRLIGNTPTVLEALDLLEEKYFKIKHVH